MVLLVGLTALMVVAAILAPTPLARSFLTQRAEAIGVDIHGLDTVKVDLLGSTIEAGPIQFVAPGAPPARIERLGLRYDVMSLALGRTLVETLVLEGVDLEIERSTDDGLRINGVDLETLRADSSRFKSGRPFGIGRLEALFFDRFRPVSAARRLPGRIVFSESDVRAPSGSAPSIRRFPRSQPAP